MYVENWYHIVTGQTFTEQYLIEKTHEQIHYSKVIVLDRILLLTEKETLCTNSICYSHLWQTKDFKVITSHGSFSFR